MLPCIELDHNFKYYTLYIIELTGLSNLQRRDDHVPIVLLKSYKEIYQILKEKMDVAAQQLKESIATNGDLDTGNYI